MKKLLFLLMLLPLSAIGQLTIDEYQRQQIGSNWNFNVDTVHINRLHVGDGKFGIDSLGRIIYYSNGAPAAGEMLYGNGTYYTELTLGNANQLLRVNAGATAPEWFTSTYLTAVDLAYDAGTQTVTNTGGTDATLPLAVDDGATEGLASFTAADFTVTAGNAAIDYANGQAATSGQDGFLQSADWTTFNNKSGLVQSPTELTAQNASIGATTVYTTPAADGYYRISFSAAITTAAGTSLDLAGIVKYTEATDNVVKTYPSANVNNISRTVTNSTGVVIGFEVMAHVKANTAIQYQTLFSFSGGAPEYNLHVTIEKLAF